MSRLLTRAIRALAVFGLLLWPGPGTAAAHESITVGDYEIEYGWTTEPPIAGQPNRIVLNIRKAAEESEHSDATEESGHSREGTEVDVSQLKVEWTYGGQTETLNLEPVGHDHPGEFTAALTPERPGKYTLRLSGLIDQTAVNSEVQPEEVLPTDTASGPGNSVWLWIAVAVVLAGGIAVTALALRRRK
jgi:hypothetical protein